MASGLTHAKARLTLGIVYVGTTVCVSLFFLLAGIPQKLSSLSPEPAYLTFKLIFFSIFIYEVMTFLFDLSGYLIDRSYQRSDVPFSEYLRDWTHASFHHALILMGMAVFALSSFKLGGVLALVLVMTLMSVFLIWKQGIIASFLSGVRYEEPDQHIKAEFPENRQGTIPLVSGISKDKNFTGGIVGFPGKETLVLPKLWLDRFSFEELYAELTRRNQAIKSGSRARGVYVAIAFNSIGITISSLLAIYLSKTPLDTFAGLLTMSLYFTLWSFIGLLILPRLSHKGVFEVDYLALEKGVKPDILETTIYKVDKYLEDEHERKQGRDLVFHPIPARSTRLSRIKSKQVAEKGAWNCARYSIFLSITGLSLLGKAVHCNAGRPNLWVLLPCD